MKFHILKPFIFQALYGAFLFVAIPLILLLGPWIEIEIMDSIVFVFILVGIILYFNVILFEIIPGVYALVDLITDDFISQNVVFVEMYADRRRLFATRGEKSKKVNVRKEKGYSQDTSMRFLIYAFLLPAEKNSSIPLLWLIWLLGKNIPYSMVGFPRQ